MGVGHLVVREGLKKKKKKNRDISQEYRIQPGRAPNGQNGIISNEINNIMLDYSTKYKINIYESI